MAGTAIFDLDRTLTRSGTWSRYVFRVNKNRLTFYFCLPVLVLHGIAYKLGLCSRRSVKEHGLKTLTWASEEELKRQAAAFAQTEVDEGLRLHAKSVLDRHRRGGDKLVMATAAAELVAEPMAEILGMDLLICTHLEWTSDRRLSGRLDGENCYGAEKLARIEAADAVDRFARPTVGYSDHISDRPFLAWADHGVAVNPSKKLERIATEAGFELQDWDRATPLDQESDSKVS